MDKVRIKNETYDVIEVSTPASNLLSIRFALNLQAEKIQFGGDIVLMTSGNVECATFSGYETLYKAEKDTLTLSNDGSVYVEPAVEPTPEPVKLTDEQKAEIEKQEKISELESKIMEVDAEFKTLDYIGIKIATDRATIDDYKPEIEKMTELADRKNQLETELAELKGEE